MIVNFFKKLIYEERDLIVGTPPRSSKWGSLRKKFLLLSPYCKLCGSTVKLEVHHKLPFHLFPELELEMSNLMTLCEGGNGFNCHLNFGHWGNYKFYNTEIDKLIIGCSEAFKNRKDKR